MNPCITIDFDNVLADSAHAFLKYYEKMYGDVVDFQEIKYPYLQDNEALSKFAEAWGDYEDFLRWAHTWDNLHPMDWAVQWITALQQYWLDLHVVTWREESQWPVTEAWLQKNFPWVFVDIHYGNDLTDKKISKWEICSSIWSIIHFDDFLTYAESIAWCKVPVLLFDAPWNTWYQWDNSYISRVDWRKNVDQSLLYEVTWYEKFKAYHS